MEVDESVREELVENLEDWFECLYREIMKYLKKIKEAESVEDIMFLKRDMLLHYVKSMPVGIDQCYFCLLYWLDDDCESCEYSAFHGVCDDNGSDYKQIYKLWNKLMKAIDEKYYSGESYDMEGGGGTNEDGRGKKDFDTC